MDYKEYAFQFQPPKKIGNVRVDFVRTNLTEFRGKMWITLFPMDEDNNSLWEFCVDTGQILKIQ